MDEYKVPNSDDVYCYIKNHSERWTDRYNRMTMALEHSEELENDELNKCISSRRYLIFMQNYSDELDEYYDYIERTLLDLQSQKR